MKKLIAAAALILASITGHAQVSVTIGGEVAPGVYGQINIGDARPQVYYSRPIIVQQPRVRIVQPPIYVYVPQEQRRDWRNSCSSYRACDREVYFVEERWYHEHRDQYRRHDNKFENGHDNRGGKKHKRDKRNGHGR